MTNLRVDSLLEFPRPSFFTPSIFLFFLLLLLLLFFLSRKAATSSHTCTVIRVYTAGEHWSFYPSSTFPCVGPGNQSKVVGTEVVIAEYTDAVCSFDKSPHSAMHSRVVPSTNGCIRDVDPAHSHTFYDLSYISKGTSTWFNGVLGCSDSKCQTCHTVIRGWAEGTCQAHSGGGSGTPAKAFRVQRVATLGACGAVKPIAPPQSSALGWVGGGLAVLAVVWFSINATPAVKKCFRSNQYERIEG